MKKCFVFFVILSMVVLLAGCGQSENVYEKEVNEIYLANVFFKFEDGGQELNHVSDWLESANNVQFVNLNKNEEIAQVKIGLSEFLKQMYSVDVSEKIDKIETNFFVSDSSVLGYQEYGTNTVCINEKVFEDNRFVSTWTHEALHMLGLKDDGSNMSTRALYDVLVESVNIQAMNWMNEQYFETSYTFCTKAGTQIILADPEIVVNSLTQEDYDILEHINNVLKDVQYPLCEIPEETTIAEQYGAYLMNIIDYTDFYMSEYGILVDFVVQEITTAYCREFKLSDELKVELEKNWLFEEYDQVVLKAENDCYYFEKK